MSEVSVVVRRRREASPVLPLPAPAAALDVDELLLEILLRLPSQPSSLLCTSIVCKRWRRLISDRGFLRLFRGHHRKPPLLGFFFFDGHRSYCFTPTLDPPDRIPSTRLSLPPRKSLAFVDCRHGLALFLNKKRPEAVVWNPISGQQCRVTVPPDFDNTSEGDILYAAVLCAASDDDHGHVHGDCDLSSFKLALVRRGKDYTTAMVCLYKSMAGVWGNVISTTLTDELSLSSWRNQGVLIGNAFCWSISGRPEGDILQFDFDMQKLDVIESPVYYRIGYCSSQIMRTKESTLGFIVVTELYMQLCEQKVNSKDVATWVLHKTIELDNHLPHVKDTWTLIQGYDEDHNVLFLRTSIGLFMIQLDSMQFKKIFGANVVTPYFPYTSFYHADWGTGGRDDGTEMSSST